MAFARIALFPEATQQQHEAVVAGLGAGYLDAPGRILFACGPCAEGWQIVQIWQSREQLEHWVQTHLGQAMARAGSDGYMYPPRVVDFELTEAYVDGADHASRAAGAALTSDPNR